MRTTASSGAAERSPRAARAPWDLPTRLFHWALVVLVVFSYVTGKIGADWLHWHMRSGYAILALLLFRLAWGVAGGAAARFSQLRLGAGAALAHARELASRRTAIGPGHTPLGSWMVVALLALLAVQAATGLFASDESSHEGPLAAMVSNAVVDRTSVIHEFNQWLIVAVVVLHAIAIAFYQWWLRIDLIGAMIRGPAAHCVRASLLLFAAACIVYALVVLLPGPA